MIVSYTINFFFKNHAGNEARKLVPDLFFVFCLKFDKGKASRLQLSFNTF